MIINKYKYIIIMNEYICNICNKKYIKKHAYDKHMTLCNDTNNDIVMAQPTCKKKTIPKALKIAVWNKYIGEEIGKTKCYCCELTDITQSKFHCGHILAEANGGDLHVDNLKPICESCNKSMGTSNMLDFKTKLISTNNNMEIDNIEHKLNIITTEYDNIYNHIFQKRVKLKLVQPSAMELVINGFDSSNNIYLDTNRSFLDNIICNKIKIQPNEYKSLSYMEKNIFINTIYQLYSYLF
tara:strand:+ start:302 stop:1018 length:717 start_codon:yes stop_codon:yes gene_type:complete